MEIENRRTARLDFRATIQWRQPPVVPVRDPAIGIAVGIAQDNVGG